MQRVASRFVVIALAMALATGWVTATPSPAAAVSTTSSSARSMAAAATRPRPTRTTSSSCTTAAPRRSRSRAGPSSTRVRPAPATSARTPTSSRSCPNVTLLPGQHYLIQEGVGTGCLGLPCGAVLPTPDVVDGTPIAMAAGAGKVALVDQATTLGCNGGSTACTATQLGHIVDLVGYGQGTGGANFFEGTLAAPSLSNSTAALRGADGATDTDQNGSDFTAGAPNPRNLGVLSLLDRRRLAQRGDRLADVRLHGLADRPGACWRRDLRHRHRRRQRDDRQQRLHRPVPDRPVDRRRRELLRLLGHGPGRHDRRAGRDNSSSTSPT